VREISRALILLQTATNTGEAEFFTGLIVIAVLTFIFLGTKKKRSPQESELLQRLVEIERAQSLSQESAQLGNMIKPQVVASLQSTPASISDNQKFESSAVIQAAIELHEALGIWMPMLKLGLSKAGTAGEEATLQMGALYSSIEQASQTYIPPVVSRAIASTLRGYVEYLTTEEGDLNCITVELAVKIVCSLSALEDGLFALLREAGLDDSQIATQCRELSAKINALASTAKGALLLSHLHSRWTRMPRRLLVGQWANHKLDSQQCRPKNYQSRWQKASPARFHLPVSWNSSKGKLLQKDGVWVMRWLSGNRLEIWS